MVEPKGRERRRRHGHERLKLSQMSPDADGSLLDISMAVAQLGAGVINLLLRLVFSQGLSFFDLASSIDQEEEKQNASTRFSPAPRLAQMGLSFGNFDSICNTAALIVCPLLGGSNGIQPTCYSRNVDVGGNIIFQPAVLFIHIVALIMVAIMVLHIRSKYTAVGRKEILSFFYLYAAVQFVALFLDSAIIPTSSPVYPWFAAVYTAFVSATCWSLLVNGFVGFQFAEDGTPLSLWFLRLSCLLVYGVSFFICIATVKNLASFSNLKPTVLWIDMYIFDFVCILVYVASQLVLVLRTLDDRWPIGDILFGTAFFAIGQVILYGFGIDICNALQHYLDSLFFFELCTLLAVMMVYKYWDSITKEDLEFSVGSKLGAWDIKEPLLEGVEDDQYMMDGPAGYPPKKGYGY